MGRTIFLIFLCAVFEGDIGKHIFVPESMTWLDAQAFCVRTYTDLTFVSSQSDQDELLTTAGGNGIWAWIGLHRDPKNMTAWKWSGGGYITYQNWDPEQPDNHENIENYACIMPNGKWNDQDGTKYMPFFCISITVVGGKKTWERAWKHCREGQTNLISLLSETNHLMARRVFQEVSITERVWIGLRYLHDSWLWVNGDPLVYEAWHQGGDPDHQCPIWKRCGALTREGLWENWDCQDELNFICY